LGGGREREVERERERERAGGGGGEEREGDNRRIQPTRAGGADYSPEPRQKTPKVRLSIKSSLSPPLPSFARARALRTYRRLSAASAPLACVCAHGFGLWGLGVMVEGLRLTHTSGSWRRRHHPPEQGSSPPRAPAAPLRSGEGGVCPPRRRLFAELAVTETHRPPGRGFPSRSRRACGEGKVRENGSLCCNTRSGCR